MAIGLAECAHEDGSPLEKNRTSRHQCDDDAASTAAAVSEAAAEAYAARCDLVGAYTAEQSCKIDSYADLQVCRL